MDPIKLGYLFNPEKLFIYAKQQYAQLLNLTLYDVTPVITHINEKDKKFAKLESPIFEFSQMKDSYITISEIPKNYANNLIITYMKFTDLREDEYVSIPIYLDYSRQMNIGDIMIKKSINYDQKSIFYKRGVAIIARDI